MAARALCLVLLALAFGPAAVLAQPRLDGPLPEPMDDAEFEVLEAFFAYDRNEPVETRPVLTCARGQCAPSDDRGTHVRETFAFTGWTGDLVPAAFARPAGATGPAPVVLLLHALNGSKEDFWNEALPSHALREALHGAGFAVLALDAPSHGQRLHENAFTQPPHLVLSGQNHRLRDLTVHSVIEHRQALDHLATRPDVDASRIAVLGFSQGAMHALALAAVDDRVRAAVAWATPVRKNYPLLYPGHFARQLHHAGVLLLAGDRDPFYTPAEADTLFGLIPSDRKRKVLYPGGHQLRPADIPAVVAWLETQLVATPE